MSIHEGWPQLRAERPKAKSKTRCCPDLNRSNGEGNMKTAAPYSAQAGFKFL